MSGHSSMPSVKVRCPQCHLTQRRIYRPDEELPFGLCKPCQVPYEKYKPNRRYVTAGQR